MTLELLRIGAETEKLGACELALLLGVYSRDNRVENFLRIATNVLETRQSILVFANEPYGWYFSQGAYHAFIIKEHTCFEKFFLDQYCIDSRHVNYDAASCIFKKWGVEFNHFTAASLKNNNQIIGYTVFFDGQQQVYNEDKVAVVCALIQTLISVINLCQENVALKEINEQQTALNYSKTKFFQIIAHDLRAPFHGLLGFSDVLARERKVLNDHDIQEISEYLFDTAQSTYNLLESLLNWAMAEGGRFICHPINFDLYQSGQIVVDVLGGLAINKNIKLINEIKTNTKVYADINMITSVIQNLVSNALKFTPIDGSGEVIIRAEKVNDQVSIYILDTGLGMSNVQIENLFEPKLTVSISGTMGEHGAGLGLVLCKRFIDLNHGSISVTSREGEGTIFKVDLPRERSMHKAVA